MPVNYKKVFRLTGGKGVIEKLNRSTAQTKLLYNCTFKANDRFY